LWRRESESEKEKQCCFLNLIEIPHFKKSTWLVEEKLAGAKLMILNAKSKDLFKLIEKYKKILEKSRKLNFDFFYTKLNLNIFTFLWGKGRWSKIGRRRGEEDWNLEKVLRLKMQEMDQEMRKGWTRGKNIW
jgi:hypothetical protein